MSPSANTSPPLDGIWNKLKQINSVLDILGQIILHVLPFVILLHLVPKYVLPPAINLVYFMGPYLLALIKKVATLIASMFLIWIILPMVVLVLSVLAPPAYVAARKAISFAKGLSSQASARNMPDGPRTT